MGIGEALVGDSKAIQFMCPFRTSSRAESSGLGQNSKPRRKNLYHLIGSGAWILMEEFTTLIMSIGRLLGTDLGQMPLKVNQT